jgi:hypothetical protein
MFDTLDASVEYLREVDEACDCTVMHDRVDEVEAERMSGRWVSEEIFAMIVDGAWDVLGEVLAINWASQAETQCSAEFRMTL